LQECKQPAANYSSYIPLYWYRIIILVDACYDRAGMTIWRLSSRREGFIRHPGVIVAGIHWK
jgi:hypothetical protein